MKYSALSPDFELTEGPVEWPFYTVEARTPGPGDAGRVVFKFVAMK